VLDRLPDGLGDFMSLAEPDADVASAVNEKRRPPLTTLATRLMETTRSFNSSTLGSIFASATKFSLERFHRSPRSDRACGRLRSFDRSPRQSSGLRLALRALLGSPYH